jgi:hypothetical protein
MPFKNVFIIAEVCNCLESTIYQMHIVTIDNFRIMADAFYFCGNISDLF